MSLPVIAYDDAAHKYAINGQPVPSVTQIIKMQDPLDALPWWGMRIGMSAVVELLQTDKLTFPALVTEDVRAIRQGRDAPLEKLVIANKLSTNHIRKERADEGTIMHDAIQKIGVTMELPDLSAYPEDFHGFIRALAKWWIEQEPQFVEQEVIVGYAAAKKNSAYAGRYDLLTVDDDDSYEIIDFKTKTGKKLEAYKSHHYQLRGYIEAHNRIEKLIHLAGGASPRIVRRGRVVILHESGNYLTQETACPRNLWFNMVERWYLEQPFHQAFLAAQPKTPRKKKVTA